MSIKKILVSQPKPTSEKSPYYDLERKYGVEVVFRQFIKVEGLTSREFRQSKINVPDYTAIILTARTAVDHFFRLCNELRYKVPDTLKYFCVSETVANYLQKYVIYRKRKIFYSETGTMDGLIPIITKHNKETYLMPVSDVHNDKTVVLDNHKVKYVKAVMYRTVSNDFKPGETFDYDMVVFFTPAGIKSYTNNFPDYMERNVVVAAMGSTTLEEAAKMGLKVDITITHETPSMASAIEHYLKKVQNEEPEEKDEPNDAREATSAVEPQPQPVKATAAVKAASQEDDEAARLLAEKRSLASKKAAATRRAKAEAAKEAARKRSEAAKKAAATRRAKAEQEATAPKANPETEASDLAAKRSEAAKKAAATRRAKAEAAKEAARKRSEAAKKAAATRRAMAEAAKKK